MDNWQKQKIKDEARLVNSLHDALEFPLTDERLKLLEDVLRTAAKNTRKYSLNRPMFWLQACGLRTELKILLIVSNTNDTFERLSYDAKECVNFLQFAYDALSNRFRKV